MDFPRRKKNRLEGYDYSQAGLYFVTICVSPRSNILWQADGLEDVRRTPLDDFVGADIIRPSDVPLSSVGKTVEAAILSISQHYDGVEVNHFCVMPDHVHQLLQFHGDLFGKTSVPPLSTVVGSLKRWVSRQLGYSIWQKSFYEHIIRTEKDYLEVLEYIERNPLQWRVDHGDDLAW